MTAKEAYKTLRVRWGDIKVSTCIEYNTLFVFVLGGEGSTMGCASVNKKTGVVQKFMPTDISQEEYKAGKVIAKFK